MNPFPPSAFPRRGFPTRRVGPESAPRARAASAILAAACLLAASLHTGCEGGSTGVDNPGMTRLPIEFRNEGGNPVPVLGSLEIYGSDHNPALDTAPLLRLRVEQDAGLDLTAADFEQALAARPPKQSAGTKRGAFAARAAQAAPAGSDTLIRFNLVFRDASGSGALAAGLSYDPARDRFALEDGASKEVRLIPKPLLHFAGLLRRTASQGEPGRIILPGTPFQATLVDSGFVLEGLPEGRFPMRLLGGDGYVYAVKESLDTQAGHAFTAAPEPIGRIAAADPPAGFGVKTMKAVPGHVGQDVALDGSLLGADTNDARVSILWRMLDKAPDDTAYIAGPTRLHTVLRHPAGTLYLLELAATFGAVTVRDTLQIKVSPPPGPSMAKFIYPLPGDTVTTGQMYKVGWDYPPGGLVRLEFSPKAGAEGTWSTIADSIVSTPSKSAYEWTPPPVGGGVFNCNLRLVAVPSDSVLGISPLFFLKSD